MSEEKKTKRFKTVTVVVASGEELDVTTIESKEKLDNFIKDEINGEFDENGVAMNKDGWQCVLFKGEPMRPRTVTISKFY